MTEANAFESVRRTFCEVMEKQVFMVPEDATAEDFLSAEETFLGGSMSFTGELNGSLVIAMPEGLAREIAANFLGVDADDESVDVAFPDALKEMLNIICGNMLTAMCGEHPVFNLTIPEVSSVPRDRVAALARLGEALVFGVEGHPVMLRLDLAPASWSPVEGEAP
jgi:chemotaxis protein CheY-P-specific phosphatase CheC